MKITIFTETGPQVGYGHLSRCLSLAQALHELNIESKFVLSGQIPDKFEILNDFPLKHVDWLTQSSEIFRNTNGSGIGIFDSYHLDKEHVYLIDKTFLLPIFLDDLNMIEFNKGIVINSSFSAFEMNYIKKSDIYYFLGPQYTMLKKDFWIKENRIQKEKINSVLVTLGANDIWNLTPNIITCLQNFDPMLKITVVVTSFFKHINQIKKFENPNCIVIRNPNTAKMRELMSNSDIAITAGGQTCFELLSMQVPSIVFITAENQHINAKVMAELEIILSSGSWKDSDLSRILNQNLAKIQSHQIRQKLIENSNKHIKFDGCRSLVKKILEIYKMQKRQ